MGGSGRWIKSLIGLKKPPQSGTDQEKVGSKGRKWKLWRSGSGGIGVKEGKGGDLVAASRSSSGGEYAFSAAVATVVRAPPKDFMAIRQEWAAIRIQTAFRAFLARQALRALKAVVRLQAIFRGRKVRKQAAITLQCMQALVRVQAKIRASSFQTSEDQQHQALQVSLHDKSSNQSDPIKLAEGGWCSSPGTVAEVKAKLKMRQKGAITRERANIYALTQQQLKANPNSLSWLERWVASKPWESRLMEEMNTEATPSPRFKKSDTYTVGSRSSFSEVESVRVKRNNVSTRISARPIPMSAQFSRSCTDPWHDESATSSSMSNSESTSSPVVGKMSGGTTPSYMNPTKSIKAKQRGSPYSARNVQRQVKENVRYLRKTMQQSSEDTNSNGESDLYPPANLDRYEWVKTERG